MSEPIFSVLNGKPASIQSGFDGSLGDWQGTVSYDTNTKVAGSASLYFDGAGYGIAYKGELFDNSEIVPFFNNSFTMSFYIKIDPSGGQGGVGDDPPNWAQTGGDYLNLFSLENYNETEQRYLNLYLRWDGVLSLSTATNGSETLYGFGSTQLGYSGTGDYGGYEPYGNILTLENQPWYKITLARDSTNYYLYVNDGLEATIPHYGETTLLADAWSTFMVLGAGPSSIVRNFRGLMDEFSLQ